MLCPATWILILSGWRPGMPVGCTAIVASVVRRSGLLCRQAIMNGLNGTIRMNTEYGLDSPRLEATPGEWYASETIRTISTDLRQMNGFMRIIGIMCHCWTVGVVPSLIPPRLTVARLDWMTSFSVGRVFRRM